LLVNIEERCLYIFVLLFFVGEDEVGIVHQVVRFAVGTCVFNVADVQWFVLKEVFIELLF